MKKLLIVFALIGVILLCGCNVLDVIFPGDEEEVPDVPVAVMEANANAVLVYVEETESTQIAWSIENVGDLFIREYIMTFDVFYPDADYPVETKSNILFEVVGNYLEIEGKHEGILDLVPYDTPETVSVSWELFN